METELRSSCLNSQDNVAVARAPLQAKDVIGDGVEVIAARESIAVMKDNIDLNAGTIVQSRETVTCVGQRIFDTIARVASGDRTKSENLGHKEFVP